MMNLISTSHLVLILSLLIPLAARAGVPKALALWHACLLLLLLLSVENSAAIMDWIIGTVVAWLPIRERIRRCRTILSRPVAPESRDFPTSEFYPRRRMTRRDKKRGGMAPAAPHFSKLAGPGLRAPRCQTSS